MKFIKTISLLLLIIAVSSIFAKNSSEKNKSKIPEAPPSRKVIFLFNLESKRS